MRRTGFAAADRGGTCLHCAPTHHSSSPDPTRVDQPGGRAAGLTDQEARPYLSRVHLYLHVPFCVRRCSYCDFSIAVRKRIPAEEYVDAVLGELRLLGAPADDASLETVYLGGGTPSLLPAEALGALLAAIGNSQSAIRNPVE